MPIALAAGLIAALGWGVVDVAAALAARRIGSLPTQVGVLSVSTGATAAALALRPDLLAGATPLGILAGVPLGILAAAAYTTSFTALRLGPLSVVSPIVVTYGGLTVILAIALRGESLTGVQAAGALSATVGVVLAGVAPGPTGRRVALAGPGVVMALVTVAIFAILSLLTVEPTRAHGWIAILVGSRLGNVGAGLGALLATRRIRPIPAGPLLHPAGTVDRRTMVQLITAGIADTIAFGAFAIGLGAGPVWQAGLASSFGPALVVAYALLRLGERPRPAQWLGLALLAIGVVTLSVNG